MYQLDEHTVSLLHFDDGIKDETGKVWTAQNGTAISSAQSKFGNSSLYLDGINQFLLAPENTDFNFGANDFTIDWWEYRLSDTLVANIFDGWYNCPITGGFGISVGWHTKDNKIGASLSSDAGGNKWDMLSGQSMGDLILNKWTHYAFVRKDNKYYTFQNGALVSTGVLSGSLKNNPYPAIGTTFSENTQYYYKGYIDEFRISNIARWDSENPPNPSDGNALLRITMSDSSEREYELKPTDLNSFIQWYNRALGRGNTCYSFDKTVGTKSSIEYLAFEKIISYKTMTINGQVFLKIIMSDSSEREYKVSSADDFIAWCNRMVAPCSTGTTYYEFTDSVDGFTEYLAFDKIISFEVIPLA